MGDLSRRRAALDLRISPSHLRAAAVGILAISGVSFGVGVLVGRDVVPAAPEEARAFLSPVADDAVVELLARVEAAAPMGDEQELTFPDALRGEGGELGVGDHAGPDAPEDPIDVPVAQGITPPTDTDTLPRGRYTVEVLRSTDGDAAREVREHLRSRELDARMAATLVEGALEYRLVVGGYRTEEGAIDFLQQVEGALEDGPAGPEPTVGEL